MGPASRSLLQVVEETRNIAEAVGIFMQWRSQTIPGASDEDA